MPFLIDRKNKFEPLWKDWDRKANKSGLRALIYNSQTSCFYKGEWQNNLKHGKGQMINPKKGIMYEGDFANNLRHGFGTLCNTACDGNWILKYRGMWKNGEKHGFGCYQYDDGSYYEGSFKHNKRCGIGRMWWPDGSFYIGEFRNDGMEGVGMLVNGDGNRYEGSFANGLKHGKGRMLYLDKGQEQEGTWIRGTARCTEVFEINFRQSAIHSTKYPIRHLELADPESVIARVRHYLFEMNCSDASLPETLNGSEVTKTFSVGSCIFSGKSSSSSTTTTVYRPYLSCGYDESQVALVDLKNKVSKSACGKRIPVKHDKQQGCYGYNNCKEYGV